MPRDAGRAQRRDVRQVALRHVRPRGGGGLWHDGAAMHGAKADELTHKRGRQRQRLGDDLRGAAGGRGRAHVACGRVGRASACARLRQDLCAGDVHTGQGAASAARDGQLCRVTLMHAPPPLRGVAAELAAGAAACDVPVTAGRPRWSPRCAPRAGRTRCAPAAQGTRPPAPAVMRAAARVSSAGWWRLCAPVRCWRCGHTCLHCVLLAERWRPRQWQLRQQHAGGLRGRHCKQAGSAAQQRRQRRA